MFLHQTQDYRRFLSSLTKFDLRLTLKSDRKLNFDPTIRMGWNQCHCEDSWIPFPMTTHGLKLELKRLRYLKNHTWRVSSLHTTITFYRWIFKMSSVLKTRYLDLPIGTKTTQSNFGKAFKWANEVRTKKLKEKTRLMMLAYGPSGP